MRLRTFTLRLDPSSGGFDDAALCAFCEEHDVVAHPEHEPLLGAEAGLWRVAPQLGGHVGGRSRDGGSVVFLDPNGHTPVHQPDLSEGSDHHVVRLEVAMQDPAAVRKGHPPDHHDLGSGATAGLISKVVSTPSGGAAPMIGEMVTDRVANEVGGKVTEGAQGVAHDIFHGPDRPAPD